MAVQQPSSQAPGSPNGQTFTLSNGQALTLPPHDEFYEEFITRNRGLIAEDEQVRLRLARILVAGCGSVGGAAIEPLIRLGAEHLVLAEPGEYDLHNMNRQSVRLQDVGRNKATVFQERMGDLNPYAAVTVDPRGIVDENVEDLVSRSTIILDGVDVTTQAPLRSKFALHAQAKRYRVPVIAGYDVAGLQMILIYDYRREKTQVLHGRVRADEIEGLEPMDFLRKVVPIAAIPNEMIPELRRQLRGERDGFPQIVYTALLFGVLACRAVLDLLAERPVRRRVIVDVSDLMRPIPVHLRVMLERLYGLYHLNNEFRRNRNAARAAAANLGGRPSRA